MFRQSNCYINHIHNSVLFDTMKISAHIFKILNWKCNFNIVLGSWHRTVYFCRNALSDMCSVVTNGCWKIEHNVNCDNMTCQFLERTNWCSKYLVFVTKFNVCITHVYPINYCQACHNKKPNTMPLSVSSIKGNWVFFGFHQTFYQTRMYLMFH